MPDYKYSLDASSRKWNCPQCKHKSFVAYLDNETKQPVDEHQFGRCDRENSCEYHHAPWMDPQHKDSQKTFVPTPDPEVIQIYPDQAAIDRIVGRTKTCVSPFHKFCNKLTISNDHLLRFGVYSEDDRTVYVFRNALQKVVNFKWFKYLADGHRDKAFKSFSLKNPSPPTPPQGQDRKDKVEKYKLCLFSEHLLDPEKQRKVMVVESEKTAAIASFFYPDHDWVSCASNNGLTDEKITVLHNRTVYWLCDADSAGRKNKSIERATAYLEEFYVCDLFPERSDGYDIADAIIDGLRPEIKPTYKPADRKKPPQVESGDAFEYDLPKGVDFETVKWDIRKYMHFEHEGRIYVVRKRKSSDSKGAMYYCEDVTNFKITALGLIASELEPSRLMEIQNVHGFSKVVQVPTKAFASPNEFTVFIESVGNFQYDGIGTDLKKIRAKLYDTMPTYEEVKRLGWQDGFFIFANGAYNGKFVPIDRFGFVKLGDKNFFIQPLSCIINEQSEDWEDEKKFIYRDRPDVKLKDWSSLFCQVHKDNGRIALAWYISSLFRDFIYRRFKFFPHLFLFGPPGTGKSQVGWSIRSLCFIGLKKPFNLNSGTDVSFFREMAQYVNVPCWYDEFGLGVEWKRTEALKNAYDGAGHAKAVDKSETRSKKTPVHSACLISGQSLPVMDNALFKRVILLQFHQTEFTDQERELFKKLQDLESGGLTHITAGFMHFRKLIEEKYLTQFDLVLTEMMKDAQAMGFEVEDRILRNSCVILTTIKVLQEKLADRLPYSYTDLKGIIMNNVRAQMALISNANETNTFWDMVEFLVREGKIKEGEDFVFDEKKVIKELYGHKEVFELPKTTELLIVRFSRIIPLYRENFRKQNSSTVSAMDKGSLIHYLTNSKPYIGMMPKVRFKENRTSAYCFNYEMLQDMGINLGGSEGNNGPPPPQSELPLSNPGGVTSEALPF